MIINCNQNHDHAPFEMSATSYYSHYHFCAFQGNYINMNYLLLVVLWFFRTKSVFWNTESVSRNIFKCPRSVENNALGSQHCDLRWILVLDSCTESELKTSKKSGRFRDYFLFSFNNFENRNTFEKKTKTENITLSVLHSHIIITWG